MKKLLIIFALLMMGASVCFAGAYMNEEEYYPPEIVKPDPECTPQTVKIVEKQTVIREVLKKERPSTGLFVGFHEKYPVLGYALDDVFAFEIGYTSIDSDQSGLIKADWAIWHSEDGWSKILLGANIYFGTAPLAGVAIGAEQYLTPSISILGYVYPIKSGEGATIISSSAIGGRIYF